MLTTHEFRWQLGTCAGEILGALMLTELAQPVIYCGTNTGSQERLCDWLDSTALVAILPAC